ncbi:hypothetical protein KXD40_004385 [Peronospora effusa]|uniref:START domain-containing protein n=1 Tax=Peronospora effusa TaxID=542832 RepID=A0A3M6VAF4_9STRA|nr:hypothetical protein DD238_005069 [Peronospora effusa]RQM14271.1 hypothetical protein DD237_005227 [Peronospora effusa]UIZ27778.1 hypothetical protein KXD40_004385 [Peronospora effusa]CAI5722800.1 unnamed protein product [Peronospora effusa]
MNFLFKSGESSPTEEEIKSDESVYPTADDVDFKAFGNESIQILLDRHTGDDKVTTWEIVEDTEAVKIWRGAVKDCDWCPFRAARRIEANKHVIEQVLLDPNRTLELDEMMEGIETLRDMGESHHLALRQITSKGQFPISGRDFLVVTYATTLKDGRIIIATRSVNVADITPLEGYVRANNYISGYIIEEFKEASGKVYCVATLLAHADLAGHIPAAIINRLGTSSTVKVLDKLESIVTTKIDCH